MISLGSLFNRQQPALLGLDISSSSVKLVELGRDASGKLLTQKLPDDQLKKYQGILGHYHIQTEKVDPGPAFQWDRVIGGAKKLMK